MELKPKVPRLTGKGLNDQSIQHGVMIHRVSFERDSVNSGPLTDEDAGDAKTSEVSTRDSSGTGRGGVRR